MARSSTRGNSGTGGKSRPQAKTKDSPSVIRSQTRQIKMELEDSGTKDLQQVKTSVEGKGKRSHAKAGKAKREPSSSIKEEEEDSSQTLKQEPIVTPSKRRKIVPKTYKDSSESEDIAPALNSAKKRKRNEVDSDGEEDNFVATKNEDSESDVESFVAIDSEDESTTTVPKRKKVLSKATKVKPNISKEAKDIRDAGRAVEQLAHVKARYAEEVERRRKAVESGKRSKSDTYGLSEGETPFPRYARPTVEECDEVCKLLRKAHPDIRPQPSTVPEPSKFVAGCGEVPSILDALVRTRLSASTTNTNSSAAYRGMVQRYGLAKSGVGRGSVDYSAVREAPVQDLFHAIKCGGLAVHKSADIKAILDIVYEENQARRKEFLAAGTDSAAGPKGAAIETEEQKKAEIKLADSAAPSLDHYYSLPTYDAIYQFMTYPGIGVKTASCVAMFCMQRPTFAVDTHVFRLSKWLGWVPPPEEKEKGDRPVDRDTTFSHLEVRVPDRLKYILHRLFIRHGKTCPRCRGNTGPGSADWAKGCVIEKLVKRTGARK